MSTLKVDTITDELGTGAPNFPNGLTGSELTEAQATDDNSTVFGTVSGERLNQETKASLNATGSAPIFACRAFVNFNGTGTVAIRASGNVSSITDNGVGRYTVNFTTAMPDANYSVVAGAAKPDSTNDGNAHAQVNGFNNGASNSNTTTSTHIRVVRPAGANAIDSGVVTVAVFR